MIYRVTTKRTFDVTADSDFKARALAHLEKGEVIIDVEKITHAGSFIEAIIWVSKGGSATRPDGQYDLVLYFDNNIGRIVCYKNGFDSCNFVPEIKDINTVWELEGIRII